MTRRPLALLFALVALSLLPGCRTVAYTDPAGRRLEVQSVALSAKFGKVEVTTPEGGKLLIENYESIERVTALAEKLADKVK
jgi:hypothetical protein